MAAVPSVLLLFALCAGALAEDVPAPDPAPDADPFESESSAWAALERLPPRASWEYGVQVTFGPITYWHSGMYPGFGLAAAWGRHIGDDRLGFGVNGSVDGPVLIHYTAALEPVARWDRVSHHVQMGASIGPAFLMHATSDQAISQKTRFGVSPSVAVRMGWSESWTRLGRRIFVVVEPKMRLIAGQPSPSASIVIGQGRGR